MKDRDKKIIELYQSGYGQTACANEVHTSVKTVKRVLSENNIKICSRNEAAKKAYSCGRKSRILKKYTKEQEQIVLACYVNQKRGLNYCKNQAGISLYLVNRILQDNKIQKRAYAEAAVESNQNRALHKNKEYFSAQSSNMAWIVGFLAADGYVSQKGNVISIALSSADREILERIKAEIEIENSIHDFTNKDGFKYSELSWTCKEHREELKKYSIVPRKTFILKPPLNLDKQFWLDYIRGYFDGDGSVNFIEVNGKKHYVALRWQVCSATPEILDFILDTLESYGIPKVSIQSQKKKNSLLYTIQYSTNSTKKIYDILYSTDSTIFLARKKKHFEEIVEKINCK